MLPVEVRGWIFQQLVKFGAALHFSDLSSLFLVWDSDLIPLKPIPLFSYVSSIDQVSAPPPSSLSCCLRFHFSLLFSFSFPVHTPSSQPRATFFAGHMSSHHAQARQSYHHMYEALTGLTLIDPPGGSWIFGW